MTPPFQPLQIFETLHEHRVAYVVIGGIAATLHGSPLTTGDVDICPAGDVKNLKRLADALIALDARVYSPTDPEGVPFSRDAEALGGAVIWNLVTRYGRLDLSFQPSGTGGYADLEQSEVRYEIDDLAIPVAALADVIRSKEAAGRERDRAALPTLRRLLERIDEQLGEG